jgi:DNA protecting protein DprA
VTDMRRLRLRDATFPALLRAIHDPPPQLFLRGNGPIDLLSRQAVAVVGARSCSSYGRSVARSLSREVAAAGLVLVSGMARGIDGEAHRGALDANGITVAVLGCGIDRDYPAAHAELARRISERGLVVSEYEPGVEPAPWRFPARKRLSRAGTPVWLEPADASAGCVAECAAGVVPVWSRMTRRSARHRLGKSVRRSRRATTDPYDWTQPCGLDVPLELTSRMAP